MKNTIPVVVSVIIGLLMVLLVSRVMSKTQSKPERKIKIVAAKKDLQTNETIQDDYLYPREVGISSRPPHYVAWANRSMVVGQKTLAPIAKDEYVLLSNLGLSASLCNEIGHGQWGVPVKFDGDSTLLQVLQRGDEIAIVGVFHVKEEIKNDKNVDAKPETKDRTVTTVLYPRVQILEKVGSNAVILSVPPQQALALIQIQQRCELFPVMRRTQDTENQTRQDGGIFDFDQSAKKLVEGLQEIEIPSAATELKSTAQ